MNKTWIVAEANSCFCDCEYCYNKCNEGDDDE